MIDRAFRWARRHLGRRGASLLYFAGLDVLYGWAVFNAASGIGQTATFEWFATIAPLQAWAGVWWAVAAICLYHAFQHHDRFGFIAAIGIKLLWGGGCVVGWLSADVPVSSVGIWLGLAGLVWIISGWPDPDDNGEDVRS